MTLPANRPGRTQVATDSPTRDDSIDKLDVFEIGAVKQDPVDHRITEVSACRHAL